MKIHFFSPTFFALLVLGFSLACGPMTISSCFAQEAETQEQDQEQEEETIEDLMRNISAAMRRGDIEEAIENGDKAMKLEPENFQIQGMMIQLLQQHGMQLVQDGERSDANAPFYRSADIARELLKNEEAMDQFGPQVKSMCSSVIYNEACSFALEGKKEKAMKSLAVAFELGFSDYELALSDSDLESVNGSAEFKELVETAKKAAVERLISETREELATFESFDFDFELEDVKGETVALKDFAGKVTIVDFWGTWCPPCREEIPSFIRLKEEYGSKGFDIVGINYEHAEGDEAVEMITDYMEENDMNYNCVIGDSDTQEQVDIEGYPTTLFIDAKGKVRLKLVGLHSYEKLESIVKLLLQENAGG